MPSLPPPVSPPKAAVVSARSSNGPAATFTSLVFTSLFPVVFPIYSISGFLGRDCSWYTTARGHIQCPDSRIVIVFNILLQILLIHVHVPEDLRPQQKIANIYFNAGREGQMFPRR
ncbi:uncharacterized protein LOC124658290 [Lolium rigidum]|uniref:uncharacterized protein LOC124658290 n=1 Tax=Lolium rigidum TaxID=89674 RepID=UPI001F5C2C8F|nr:uncharacterized protein LOC124658290 [Lolium rigidum]